LEEVFETKNPLKKLQRFIRNHFYTFLTERNFLRVFLLNIQFNRRFYSSHVYETFRHYTDALNIILEEGKKDGSIRPDVNIRVFKNLFLGAFGHMALRWLILPQEGQIDKMVEIDELVLLLLRAVAN
jgi:TetR/AcrR family fatty acid metabolism transcriptional regulator